MARSSALSAWSSRASRAHQADQLHLQLWIGDACGVQPARLFRHGRGRACWSAAFQRRSRAVGLLRRRQRLLTTDATFVIHDERAELPRHRQSDLGVVGTKADGDASRTGRLSRGAFLHEVVLIDVHVDLLAEGIERRARILAHGFRIELVPQNDVHQRAAGEHGLLYVIAELPLQLRHRGRIGVGLGDPQDDVRRKLAASEVHRPTERGCQHQREPKRPKRTAQPAYENRKHLPERVDGDGS